jgi:hypothetical protein
MYQGTQGYSLTKTTEGRKSRDTVPLSNCTIISILKISIIVLHKCFFINYFLIFEYFMHLMGLNFIGIQNVFF